MLVNIILWIVSGALAGWVANILMNRDTEMGAVANIIVGVVGAIIGGFLMMNLFGAGGVAGFNPYSVFVAILSAVVVLFLVGTIQRGAAL
jgi:uncharacterized membrane protein YeaQ/YmgE (transglycosylase-associated protein family)